MDEFHEFIESETLSDSLMELSDMFLMATVMLYQKTGVDLPLYLGRRSFRKLQQRFDVWCTLFNSIGIVFKKEYYIDGANYKRPEKVVRALDNYQRKTKHNLTRSQVITVMDLASRM